MKSAGLKHEAMFVAKCRSQESKERDSSVYFIYRQKLTSSVAGRA